MRKVLEGVGLGALALLIWITYDALAGPSHLPDRIPTHFDAAGNANGWGSPATLLLLPILAVGLYLLITVVSMFPASFNYPVRVTAENRERLQGLTLNMVTWLKTELACLFAAIQWAILQAVRSGEGRLPVLLVPGFLVLIFGTALWHIFALFRAAQPGGAS